MEYNETRVLKGELVRTYQLINGDTYIIEYPQAVTILEDGHHVYDCYGAVHVMANDKFTVFSVTPDREDESSEPAFEEAPYMGHAPLNDSYQFSGLCGNDVSSQEPTAEDTSSPEASNRERFKVWHDPCLFFTDDGDLRLPESITETISAIRAGEGFCHQGLQQAATFFREAEALINGEEEL
jgi:hypothetical protein